MDRRQLLVSGVSLAASLHAPSLFAKPHPGFHRVRPGHRDWPNARAWRQLSDKVGGRLIKPVSPFEACRSDPGGAACEQLFRDLRNPYFIADNVALTQTLGYAGAWTSQPSAYAVAANTARDVVAAVNFARDHRLRLVVKGGGHSYLGTSNAQDSLMIWTRGMNAVETHDAFVPMGCEGKAVAQPAVSLGAGCRWIEAYSAVTTKGGRYVQGGGCTTVGVAGLVQSGGFGSFSKCYGTAAGGLLEAEIVTADGQVRTANACLNPDLYWAIRGGGGGGFGVVTRLTLRTHALPKFFGAAQADISAKSPEAFHKLVGLILAHYRDHLMNPHWGEQIGFSPNRQVQIRMVFQGLERDEAQATWKPFFDKLKAAPDEFEVRAPLIMTIPAARFWDPSFLTQAPGVIRSDDRPGAPSESFYWSGDGGQVGQVLHAYTSVWLSKDLLLPPGFNALVDTVVKAASLRRVGLHFNKGLAGAPEEPLAEAQQTATNPAVLNAFALAILGAGEGPAYPGVKGHEPNLTEARLEAEAVKTATDLLKTLQVSPGSYVSESDYFEPHWSEAFWGPNYSRLLKVKTQYDPDGLFFTHHGVGTEPWSADGFDRLG